MILRIDRRRVRTSSAIAVALLAAGCASWALAADFVPRAANQPKVAEASNEGELAIQRFRVPKELKIHLYAAEPMVANPVAFCFDEKGRVYVAETFRQGKGVEDNRGHMNWLDADLATQTVEDRLKYFQKFLGDKLKEYSDEDDRVRLLEDRDGDGKADHATVFAEGFNGPLDGTGAGLLARRGNVYYTCIPNLWLLRDTDGDGKADMRESLSYGYGVRVAFRGHDSHGLRMGPDGRIYFSIGDRGYHIESEGRVLAAPDRGAVFRCNPDGSELEVFATGLRNPQELAFDQYGNLFTGDNNSDSGDRARWVHVVEGGDTGWRMYYQYLNDRGPWNREKLWHPQHEGQPAYIVPPIINLGDGPSGLAYYPGLGLPERYNDHFFMCDFRGGPANSGVRSFAVKPRGASFELVDSHEFLWSVLVTDCEFGYDGGFYFSDWVDGWNGQGKGRIYKAVDPELLKDPKIAHVGKLMAEGFTQRSPEDLAKLLRHPDMRIRQEAQFALAERGEKASDALLAAAKQTEHQLARLHGIWGLGQIGRKSPERLAPLLPLLQDDDPEVRAQVANVLGDARAKSAAEGLIGLLKDENLRVRAHAAAALGKLGDTRAVAPLQAVLEENADKDPTLRHCAVMGLVGSAGDRQELYAAGRSISPAVRMGVVLALRRLADPQIAQFLNDTEPRIVEETARAIYDLPIAAVLPNLADLSDRTNLTEPTWWRVVGANYQLGKPENAVRIASIASRNNVPERIRVEALGALENWAEPSGRDRVLGDWRPVEKRPADVAAQALPRALVGVFTGSDNLRKVGAQVAAKLGVREVGPLLAQLVSDPERPAEVRAEAIRALQALKNPQLNDVLQQGLRDNSPLVRSAALQALAAEKPAEALPLLAKALDEGTAYERQQAIDSLASLKSEEADKLLAQWLDRLLQGSVPAELHLDLLTAAGKRDALKSQLQKYEAARAGNDPLAAWRETLLGGDADRGKRIFLERAQVSCVRCHKVRGEGGDVGPDLSKLGREKPREYLLESIVAPNAQIAKGFETAVVVTDEGRVHVGIVKKEDQNSLQLMTSEGKLIDVPKTSIEERTAGKSPMPEDLLKHLSKADLRDLVEFLASQTQQ